MSLPCHTEVRGINVTCRGFQCHKLFQWSNNAVAAWNLPQVLWSLAVMSCAAIVPAGLSCVSFIIASSNAYGSLHLSDSIDFRGVFLISDSPFLCDKETFFFFLFCLQDYVAYILWRVISLILLRYSDSTIIISLDSCSLEF